MNFLKIKNFLQKNFSIILPIFIYLLITIIVSPLGEHAVNDDWQFYTHVKYFSEGKFIKNPLIDSAFVLQGFIGMYWIKLFGLSFISLRVLTIIFTIIFFLGVYKILKFYQLKKQTILVTFLAILIEPVFLTSSYSFMTEIYFLTFIIWSLYFFLKGIENPSSRFLVFSIILGSLSLLIRQFGIILFLSYLIYIFLNIKDKKIKINYLILLFFCFFLTSFYSIFFPQYFGSYNSNYDKLSTLIGSFDDILVKLTYYLKYLVYISFFIAPLSFSVQLKNRKLKILAFVISFIFAYQIFKIDIFDLGNVFHIECLYCETQFKNEVSLFDNIFFKLFLSYLLALNFILIIFKLYENKFWIKPKKYFTNPLLATSLGMFFIILFVDSFYDRYFLNFAILFIIFLSITLDKIINPKFITGLITSLFLIIIIFLNIDFYKSAEIKWQQSLLIRKLADKNGEIYTLGSFYRFILAQEADPYNLFSATYQGKNDCYVNKYSFYIPNFITKVLERQKYGPIENPAFSSNKLFINIPKLSKNRDNIIAVQEYFSPAYNLLGIKNYIVSFCDSTVINKKNIKTIDENLKF